MNEKKVLIIDDEAPFTDIVKLTLEGKGGYEVCAENNPLMALDTARKFEPDIVLLDVIMPELDGGEVYRELMADPLLKDIPVLFVTAMVQQKEVDAHKGMFGGKFIIAKPVSANELIEAIEEHARP